MITPQLQALMNKVGSWQQILNASQPIFASTLIPTVSDRIAEEVQKIYAASYPAPAAGQSPQAYLQALEAAHLANAQEVRLVIGASLQGVAFQGATKALLEAVKRLLV